MSKKIETIKLSTSFDVKAVRTDPNSVDEHALDRSKAALQQGRGPKQFEVAENSVGGGSIFTADNVTDIAEALNDPNSAPGSVIGNVESMRFVEHVGEDVAYTPSSVGTQDDRIAFAANNKFDTQNGISVIDDAVPAPKAGDYIEGELTITNGKITGMTVVDKTVHENKARFSERALKGTNLAGFGVKQTAERLAMLINEKIEALSDGVGYAAIATLPDLEGITNYFMAMGNHVTHTLILAMLTARKFMSEASSHRDIYGDEVNDAFMVYLDGVADILNFRNDAKKINNTAEITFLNYLSRIISDAESVFKSYNFYYDARNSFLSKEVIRNVLFKTYTAIANDECDYVHPFTYGTNSIRLVRPYTYGTVTKELASNEIVNGFGGGTEHFYQAGRGKTAQPKVYLRDPIIDGIQDFLDEVGGTADFNTAKTVDMVYDANKPLWSFLVLAAASKIIDQYAVVISDFSILLEKLGCKAGFENFRALRDGQYKDMVSACGLESYNQGRRTGEVSSLTRFNFPNVIRKVGSFNPAGWSVGSKSKHEYMPWLVGAHTFVDDDGIIDFTGRMKVPGAYGKGDAMFDLLKVIDPVILIDDTSFEADGNKYPVYNFDNGFYFCFDKCAPINYLRGRQMFGAITPLPAWYNDSKFNAYSKSTKLCVGAEDVSSTRNEVMHTYLTTPIGDNTKVNSVKIGSAKRANTNRITATKRAEYAACIQLSSWTLEFPIRYNKRSYLHVVVPNGLITETGVNNAIYNAVDRVVGGKTNKSKEVYDYLVERGLASEAEKMAIDVSKIIGFPMTVDSIHTSDGFYEACDMWGYWSKRMCCWTNPMVAIANSSGKAGAAVIPHQILNDDDYIAVEITFAPALREAMLEFKVKTLVNGCTTAKALPADNPTLFQYEKKGQSN